MEWMEKAAKQGHPQAVGFLTELYGTGVFGEEKYEKAFELDAERTEQVRQRQSHTEQEEFGWTWEKQARNEIDAEYHLAGLSIRDILRGRKPCE